MTTADFRKKVDAIWNVFWSGGITNPMNVIEQMTYLIYMRQLDLAQDDIDKKRAIGVPVPESQDIFGPSPQEQSLRWKNLIAETDPVALRNLIANDVFAHLRQLGGTGMSKHMANATFGIENPSTLRSVMALMNELDFRDKDFLGDLYEYLLSQLSTSGKNGQFRTTQHIIKLMVELMRPAPGERIIDPACGTAGFLVNAALWMKEHHADELLKKDKQREFSENTFYGYDFDSTMVRISAMNMFMHGFKDPNIAYRDSLAKIPSEDVGSFDLILANPPFAGSTDEDNIDPELRSLGKTKKTELLFINRFLSLLKIGGRAAVIVPEGVLFGSTKVHKALRKELVENQSLDGVIKLPSGAFKPYTGVSTAILCFTRTDSPATDNVWFYEVLADGYSLDDKRTPLLDEHLLGVSPLSCPVDPENPGDCPEPATLTEEQHAKNNLPDVVRRFAERKGSELERVRTEQSFCVPVAEIAENDYDLSMNRYKEIVFEDVETRDPMEIIADIEALDVEIAKGMAELKVLLGGEK
ncbi:MAG: class I SAM-dependent DNA methyltransferase [Corynebacterium sp.]|uniref:class I SAM-dependent DNA methyltransferase n=1 Tax=Corynebacterium sp. TaxID=1720 RepID=UPI0026DCA65D|nr:class I SAM-dependent DNA methyltransferase [Corynebacterium sp.]MDO5029957.1 class I SAM-dependent DNA methyltransferase [Corynebacterium sp.]